VSTLKRKVLARGQWGLDPAYGVNRNLRFPDSEPFSLDYVYNPYLGVDLRAGQGAPLPAAAPEAPAVPVAVPAVAAVAETAAAAESGSVEVTAQVDGTLDILVSALRSAMNPRGSAGHARERHFHRAAPRGGAGAVTVVKLGGRGQRQPDGPTLARQPLHDANSRGGSARGIGHVPDPAGVAEIEKGERRAAPFRVTGLPSLTTPRGSPS